MHLYRYRSISNTLETLIFHIDYFTMAEKMSNGIQVLFEIMKAAFQSPCGRGTQGVSKIKIPATILRHQAFHLSFSSLLLHDGSWKLPLKYDVIENYAEQLPYCVYSAQRGPSHMTSIIACNYSERIVTKASGRSIMQVTFQSPCGRGNQGVRKTKARPPFSGTRLFICLSLLF